MTHYATPRGFVKGLETIRSVGRALPLYFDMKQYQCCTTLPNLPKPPGTILVGVYDAQALGETLARSAREDLEQTMERAGVPRGTRDQRDKSKACRKNDGIAGRRSV